MIRSALLMFFMAVTFSANAQNGQSFYSQPYSTRNSGSFSLNHRLFSVSYGFPTVINNGFNSSGLGFGPLMARFEAPIMNELGIAGLVQVAGRGHHAGPFDDHAFAFGFGGIGFYHFNKLIPLSKLDLYAGIGVGVNFTHINYDDIRNYEDDNDVDVLPLGVVGARYYFTPGFAGFAEAGFTGMSNLNLGLTWRL